MFIPKRVIFEKGSLNYPLGKELLNRFKESNTETVELSSNKVGILFEEDNVEGRYMEYKRTLFVDVKKSGEFQTCRPSAHYQLPLVSGCAGMCEYCYLSTRVGDRPYIKAYVNIDEILNKAQKYIDERSPDSTIFEGAATSDPVPVEPYTHGLERCIDFFAQNEKGLFRFVTKYCDIDSLLPLKHNGHTEIRFTVNTDRVIKDYEHGAPELSERIEAARKTIEAGYPTGFVIAPVFMSDGWENEYSELLIKIRDAIQSSPNVKISFEVISYRFTTAAKSQILKIYKNTKLPMDVENMAYKYGQFGYSKYVYPKESLAHMKEFFQSEITKLFPDGEIKYII